MKQLDRVEIEKMKQLADFLETVPPEDFDIDAWVTREPMPRQIEKRWFGLVEKEVEPACGFAGCAMGWAAFSGLFDGLRVLGDWEGIGYRGATDFRAAELLFGINNNNSLFLFSPDFDDQPEPWDVAERLRRFVEKVESRKHRRNRSKLRLVA